MMRGWKRWSGGKRWSDGGAPRAARWLGMLCISLLFVGSACKDRRRALDKAEVKALFSNKTVVGHHDVHGYDFRSYYDDKGTFRSYQGGSKTPRHARWWVMENGRICIRWHDKQRTLCRTMVTDDKGRYWKILRRKRKAIVTFRSFVAGNPHKL